MIMNNLELINSIIERHIKKKCSPYSTTEGSINNNECGNHRGLYYIYPEVNFYFGLAKSKNATIIDRHKKHRAKLDVDLKRLYGPSSKKKQPAITFPKGWQEGICKYIIDEVDEIPKYYEKLENGYIEHSNLFFPVKHLINVNQIRVVVWNLHEYSSEKIKAIEDEVIKTIYPYCNDETYKLRQKLRRLFLKVEKITTYIQDYNELLAKCFTFFQKEILNNVDLIVSGKNFYKLKFAKRYFVDNQDKYNHLLQDIFLEWYKIVESNNI